MFDQEVEWSCAIEDEILELTCHTFLNVYIQRASFGRSFVNGKTLCDGDKGEDSKSVDIGQNCLEQAVISTKARKACRGQSSCSIPVTAKMAVLEYNCKDLKRELRTDYICGMCIIVKVGVYTFFLFSGVLPLGLLRHFRRLSHHCPAAGTARNSTTLTWHSFYRTLWQIWKNLSKCLSRT